MRRRRWAISILTFLFLDSPCWNEAWEEAQAALSAASGSITLIKVDDCTPLWFWISSPSWIDSAGSNFTTTKIACRYHTQKNWFREVWKDDQFLSHPLISYNIESSRIVGKVFEDLKQYIVGIQQGVSYCDHLPPSLILLLEVDVKRDLPLVCILWQHFSFNVQMFSQIIDSFCARWLKISPNQGFPQNQQTPKPVVKFFGSTGGIEGMNVISLDSLKETESDPLNGVNQLSSLARIGLEMVVLSNPPPSPHPLGPHSLNHASRIVSPSLLSSPHRLPYT